jgi:succinyl-CoA synthetase alpha subunit
MSILIDIDTRVIVQGITGKEGRFHAAQMRDYGTQVVGGVTPGRGGEWVESLPVFDGVRAAREMTGANTSVIFVPPAHAADAIYEAVEAEIDLIICITEGIPLFDMMRVYDYVKRSHSRLIGPNCPGIMVPELATVGIIPGHIGHPGDVGVVSKSGALTYDVVDAMSAADIGQSVIVGIGADPIVGTSFINVLEMLENDPETEKIVLLGEIGGRAEIDAAEYIKANVTKLVTAFVAGRSAPPDRRMGHAGAIIERGRGYAEEKIAALREAGVRIADNPEEIPNYLR